MTSALSIIIPVLNEERTIAAAVSPFRLARERGAEILVVDGGSQDDTIAVATGLGLRCLTSEPGRAGQMNLGARHAHGDMLAFLHADTIASEQAVLRLTDIANRGLVRWGRFDVRIDDDRRVFRIIAWAMNFRSRVTQISTGDQMVFVHRSLFDAVGGYPAIALMEDVAISKRLRAQAPALCCHEVVNTSARRWQRNGPIRTLLLMWWLRIRFVFGADPAMLAMAYRSTDTDAG